MDDLISRQKAIMDAESWVAVDEHEKHLQKNVIEWLKEFPPAQPEPKTGKWIGTEFYGYADGNPVCYEWQCSECGCIFEDEEPTYNFCPNCGAKMTISTK